VNITPSAIVRVDNAEPGKGAWFGRWNTGMQNKLSKALLGLILASLLQGCVAIPPLIQVQHKDNGNSLSDIQRRLDSIDRRLDRLEQKSPAEAKPAP
jgi:hypothetical protein